MLLNYDGVLRKAEGDCAAWLLEQAVIKTTLLNQLQLDEVESDQGGIIHY